MLKDKAKISVASKYNSKGGSSTNGASKCHSNSKDDANYHQSEKDF